MSRRVGFIEGTTLQLDLWGEQLQVLENRLTRTPRARRDRLHNRLDLLQRRRRRLRRRLQEAARDPGIDWPRERRDLEQAAREFRERASELCDEA